MEKINFDNTRFKNEMTLKTHGGILKTDRMERVNMKTKITKSQKARDFKGFCRRNNRQFYFWALAIIPILYVFLFNYCTKLGIIIAFKDYNYADGILGSKWVGFDNFKFFITSGDFARVVKNTVLNNLVFIAVGMISAVVFALLLYELTSRKATKVYQTTVMTPHFVSWIIGSYIVYAFLNPQSGVVNALLTRMGIESVNWYANPKPWPIILTICFVWKNIGMDSILYYSTLMSIDESLFEAAEVDGASRIQKTWYVTLPELKNLICLLLVMKIGGIFSADFGLFYQVPRNVGALYPTTDVISTYVFRAMTEVKDFGMSTAVSFADSVVGFIMVYTTNMIMRKYNEESALF